ncbi:MAG: hypothetical protein A2V88_00790 [Elusimicrobia bacterium RBG_16_66_12]|nr:MAG: hypothetical protein A2V88_00790 [Elusimicrobia bacterium RBG_16_66_12]
MESNASDTARSDRLWRIWSECRGVNLSAPEVEAARQRIAPLTMQLVGCTRAMQIIAGPYGLSGSVALKVVLLHAWLDTIGRLVGDPVHELEATLAYRERLRPEGSDPGARRDG